MDLIKTQKTTNSGFSKEHTRLLTVDLTITQKTTNCELSKNKEGKRTEKEQKINGCDSVD